MPVEFRVKRFARRGHGQRGLRPRRRKREASRSRRKDGKLETIHR